MSLNNPTPLADLEEKELTPEVKARLDALLLKLVNEMKNNVPLTEHEKRFVFHNLLADSSKYGKPDNYAVLEDEILKHKYVSYPQKMVEGETYFKFDAVKMKQLAMKYAGLGQIDWEEVRKEKDNLKSEIPANEVKQDLIYFDGIAMQWEGEVYNLKHTDDLLKIVTKETREMFKDFEKNLAFEKGTFLYKAKRKFTFVHYKYLYLWTKYFWEIIPPSDKVFQLNGQNIECDEKSIFHIVSRHFSPDSKQWDTGKSFFTPEFPPEQLHIDLGKRITEIDKSGLYSADSINKISFEYKGIDYKVWVKEDTKNIKGQPNTKYYRVDSFYPIDSVKEKKDLSDNYSLKKVNDDLSVYVKN